MKITEEVVDAIQEEVADLERQILNPKTPAEVTNRLRWARSTLLAVKAYATEQTTEININETA